MGFPVSERGEDGRCGRALTIVLRRGACPPVQKNMETSPLYIHVTHRQATHDEDLSPPLSSPDRKENFFHSNPFPTSSDPPFPPHILQPQEGSPRRCKSMWRGRWKRVQKLGGNGASRCQEERRNPRRGLLSLTSKTSPHFPHTYSER